MVNYDFKTRRFFHSTSWHRWCDKGTGKRGHIVADTLLLMMYRMLRKLGNICCGHKICVRNKCCARGQTGKHLCQQQCVRKNVSSFASTLIGSLKVLANEDTLLRTRCFHVAPCCANWETFVADTKCFWPKSETFFVSRTQNLCPQQMLRARANGETFVSATMCPRLPVP